MAFVGAGVLDVVRRGFRRALGALAAPRTRAQISSCHSRSPRSSGSRWPERLSCPRDRRGSAVFPTAPTRPADARVHFHQISGASRILAMTPSGRSWMAAGHTVMRNVRSRLARRLGCHCGAHVSMWRSASCSKRKSSAVRDSSRARAAPTQKWIPRPKLRCVPASRPG